MNKITLLISLAFVMVACKPDPKPPTGNEPNPTAVAFPKPSNMPQPNLPADNPLTLEGIQLGRHLFFDERLSGDNTMSCASCHLQENNFSDPNQFSTGITGAVGDKNAMAIVNLAWQDFFFWDGRRNSLESQALDPIEDPREMNTTWDAVLQKLNADPKYQEMFTKAFGPNSITKENAAKAIAQFERMMISGNSRYDKWRRGEIQLTTLESLGLQLFNNETGDCFHCHAEPVFGAFGLDQFMNNGLDSVLKPGSGREAVTGNPLDRAKFKSPSLRNIEYSFPYMHDGRFQTLQEVIEHYNMGGHMSATLDPNMKAAGVGRNWSLQQKDALLAFLMALSDVDYLTDTTFTSPW